MPQSNLGLSSVCKSGRGLISWKIAILCLKNFDLLTLVECLLADCLTLQFYRDSKDKCKNGQTKSSLSLEKFLGIETGFTLDKESNTIALLCSDVVIVIAFDTRELLIQWQVKIRNNVAEGQCTSTPTQRPKTKTGEN